MTQLIRGVNDVVTIRPDLVKNWSPENDFSLSDVTVGSGKRGLWLCEAGHSYRLRICDRVSGRRCTYCFGRRVLPGFNDLATKFSEIAMQWHPENEMGPHEVAPRSNKKARWVCSEGHEWTAVISTRVPPASLGCPVCAGQAIRSGINDLYTLFPELRASWHPDNKRSMHEVGPGSTYRARWICELGHEWEATLSNRTYNGRGCPFCSNQAVMPGYNDLGSKYPHLAREWSPANELQADEVTAFSKLRAKWVCPEAGHEYETRVVARTADGTGCPQCHPVPQSMIELNFWMCLETRFGLELERGVAMPVQRKSRGRSLIDAVVVGERIALEYDGWFWHHEERRIDSDTWKSLALLDAGWSVIRIREIAQAGALPPLPIDSPRYVEVQHRRIDGFMIEDLVEPCRALAGLISSMRRSGRAQEV
jgi:hypothetical protein